MKYRLMELLVCPECGSALGLEAWKTEEAPNAPEAAPGCQESCYFEDRHCERCLTVEVLEGLLRCRGCPRCYPIIGGVPRMLPDDLRNNLLHYHAPFFERHPEIVPLVFLQGSTHSLDGSESEKAPTLWSYSYQRIDLTSPDLRYAGDWLSQFKSRIKPHAAADFTGKLGLDAGCGFGRYSHAAEASGAEVIGLDFSEGVGLAHENNRGKPRVHVVQGDIYRMPFRPATFDFAFAFGLLHFLPSPREGFRSVVNAVRPGGDVMLWVYGYKGMSLSYRLSHMRTLRRLTTRLPRRVQAGICAAVALALEVFLWMPSRVLNKFSAGRKIAKRLPAQSNSYQPFRMKITAVYNRLGTPVTHFLNREELVCWFQEAGLSDVRVWSEDRRGWQACGKKGPLPAPETILSVRDSFEKAVI
jgi:uncharacterized protein YbaR (Trm112 family)/ubiquinone/menaquinone biosynthesis C-methylase UbiE